MNEQKAYYSDAEIKAKSSSALDEMVTSLLKLASCLSIKVTHLHDKLGPIMYPDKPEPSALEDRETHRVPIMQVLDELKTSLNESDRRIASILDRLVI